jgi:biotin carboxyl carrier protein
MENEKKLTDNNEAPVEIKPDFKTFQVGDAKYKTLLNNKYLNRKPWKPIVPGNVTAFIPGIIRKIYVKEGQKVKEGDKLVVLEAMKMRNDVTTPINGKVKKIHAKIGKRVTKMELLVEIE